MINKEEINQKANEFEIHTSNVQRDYVFGWIISGIYSISKYRDILTLKGGNAFRKAYFPTTRFSNDLDFTTTVGIDSTDLLFELNKVCKFVQQNAGIEFVIDRNQINDENIIRGHKKVYKIRLYFKDFYGNPEKITISVRVDVTEFDKVFLPIQTRKLIHPYSDTGECNVDIRVIKLEEALADKLKCLLQRRHSFDLFDLVYAIFINKEIELDRAELIKTFLGKTIFEPSPVTARNLLLGVPFDLFKSYWNTKIVCPKESLIPFDSAVKMFMTGLDSLFDAFSYGLGRQMVFFPAHLRNPILQAGTEMTLLKVTYKGIPRIVEPYSLVYKRRKDGYGQEYFYVYDRTGGRTSGPGIKSFVNANVNAIENTSEKFEPRYEVELSKAGEFSQKTYFSRPFGRRRAFTRFSSFSQTNEYKYIVQCAYCGKQFKRKRPTTKVNPHKDQYGNKCYGRSGFIVY